MYGGSDEYLKKIIVIDLWIYKISVWFLLAFQIRSKLRKNQITGLEKPVLKATGEEEDF